MTLSEYPAVQSFDYLLASAAKTTTGAATAVSGFQGAGTLIVQLAVTVVSGTDPTLDVLVEDTIDGTNYHTIATFTQKVATGVQVLAVTAPFAGKLRASWTIGGTNTPTFTFSVLAYSKL